MLTLSEAAALLEKKRGSGVHRTSIYRWGKEGWFKLHWVNGWKVRQDEFLQWAARCGRLKRPTC